MSKRCSSPLLAASPAKRQETSSAGTHEYYEFCVQRLADARQLLSLWKCGICTMEPDTIAVTLCGKCLFCPHCIQQYTAREAARFQHTGEAVCKAPWSISLPNKPLKCPTCQEETSLNWKRQWPLQHDMPGILHMKPCFEKVEAFAEWIKSNSWDGPMSHLTFLPDVIGRGSKRMRIDHCNLSGFVNSYLCPSPPCVCSYCTKHFAVNSDLISHIRRDQCFYKGVCWHCNMQFVSTMRNHVLYQCFSVQCPVKDCNIKGAWDTIGKHILLHLIFEDPFNGAGIIRIPSLEQTTLNVQHIAKFLANFERVKKTLTYHGNRNQEDLFTGYEALAKGVKAFWEAVSQQEIDMNEN